MYVDTANETNTLKVYGTEWYASPEQKKSVPKDNKTDIFSLGVVLFELFYPSEKVINAERDKVR